MRSVPGFETHSGLLIVSSGIINFSKKKIRFNSFGFKNKHGPFNTWKQSGVTAWQMMPVKILTDSDLSRKQN